MQVGRKLAVLADAAKYDAACASSGARGAAGAEVASPEPGISYATGPDGRPMPLLRVLLSNECVFDCRFCALRRSHDIERLSFSVGEVVALTLDYHRRGLIEGLFLSSGVAGSPDDTMEQMVRVARELRCTHFYFGYIHLKTIPNASPELIDEAGRWADRLSVNIELPRPVDLERLAPEKDLVQIAGAMSRIREGVRAGVAPTPARDGGRARPFAPAGQTTQMIVGATDATDADILLTASELYARVDMRRIYYSAFVPHAAAAGLPEAPPPLLRELRLYQADWLIRSYGFTAGDLTPPGAEHLDLDIDPKLAWALRHRDRFPVDVNKASRTELLAVPGFGSTSVQRILDQRRVHRLAVRDLTRLRIPMRRALPFIVASDHVPRLIHPDSADLRERLAPARPATAQQLDLFLPGEL